MPPAAPTASTISSRGRQRPPDARPPRTHAEPLRVASPSKSARLDPPRLLGSASAPTLPTLARSDDRGGGSLSAWQHHGHHRWQYEHERSRLRTPEPRPFTPLPSSRHRLRGEPSEPRPETAPTTSERSRLEARLPSDDSGAIAAQELQLADSPEAAPRPSDLMHRRVAASAAKVLGISEATAEASFQVRRDSTLFSRRSSSVLLQSQVDGAAWPPAVLVDDEKIFAPPKRMRRRSVLARDALRVTNTLGSLLQKPAEEPKPRKKLGGGLGKLKGRLSAAAGTTLQQMEEQRRAAAAEEYREAKRDALRAFAEHKLPVAVDRLERCIELNPRDDALHRMRARALALDGHVIDGLEEANAAVVLNQRHPANYVWHGRCLHKLRQLPEAGVSYLSAMRNGRPDTDLEAAGYAGFLDDVRRQRGEFEARPLVPLDRPKHYKGSQSHGRFLGIFDERKQLESPEGGGGADGGGSAVGCQLLAPRLWCSDVDDKQGTAHWLPVGLPAADGSERRDSLAEDVSSYTLELARHTVTWEPEGKTFVEAWGEYAPVHEGSRNAWTGALVPASQYRLRVRAFDLLKRPSPWSDVIQIHTPSRRELNEAAASADDNPANAVLPRAWLGCDLSDVILEHAQASRGATPLEAADAFLEAMALALAPHVLALRQTFRLYACSGAGATNTRGLGRLQFTRMARECGLAKGLAPRGGRAPRPDGAEYTPVASMMPGEVDLIFQRANLDDSELSGRRRHESAEFSPTGLKAQLPLLSSAVYDRLFSGEGVGDATGMPAPPELLRISGIKAFDVPDVDAAAGSGCSDPYVTISLLEVEPAVAVQTATVENETNPVWEDTLVLRLPAGSPRPPLLRVMLWDDDENTEDDPIGACTLRLDEVVWERRGEAHYKTVQLESSARAPRGAAKKGGGAPAAEPIQMCLGFELDEEYAAAHAFAAGTDDFLRSRARDARTGEADEGDGGRELMTLTEWVGGLARLAWQVLPSLDGIGPRLSTFIEEVLLPTAEAETAATQSQDAYDGADEVKVRAIFEFYDKDLRKIFESYAAADQLSADARGAMGSINLSELTFMTKEGKLFDANLTVAGLNAIFVRVNTRNEGLEAEGEHDDDEQELVYEEFLEALARMCCAKLGLGTDDSLAEPFELSLQSWLGLFFVPTYRRILKEKAKGLLKKTL